MNEKTKYMSFAGIIAACYVVLTFVSSMLGLSSGTIQVRFSEGLNTLVCYTGAAVPGLFIGCLVANLFTGGCALDLVFGSLATLIGAFLGRKLSTIENGKYNMLVPIPTILANAIIVPWVLQKGYNVPLEYNYLFITVVVGEVISAGLIGMFVYFSLYRISFFRNMMNEDKPSEVKEETSDKTETKEGE